MATIHISEAEATRDFAAVMAHIRAGSEVIIDAGDHPAAILRPPDPPRRLLSESLRLAREAGSCATLDAGFSQDLERAIESHAISPRNLWE